MIYYYNFLTTSLFLCVNNISVSNYNIVYVMRININASEVHNKQISSEV